MINDISHPVYEYVEDGYYETLKTLEFDLLCPNKTLVNDKDKDRLHRTIHTSIMTSTSVFSLTSNILSSLFLL